MTPVNSRSVVIHLERGATLDLLKPGEPLERVMIRGGWQTDSTDMKYLRNWCM